MFVKQIYTNCLAQASYFIESEGIAAIIDPIRDLDQYFELAKEKNAEIKYIFETHFHADFVSGHLDLAKKTGAQIVFGDKAECGFEAIYAKDEQVFPIGKIAIKVHHTPGHTPESVCYELVEENGQTHAIFTGDTLFSGDVGRPDLCQAGLNLSKEEMAAMLYDSLQKTIMPLKDEVILYPGHGPGSACGKSLGPDTVSTIGKEKAFNYALQPMPKEEFIAQVTEGIVEPPSYFFEDASQNKNGYDSLDSLVAKAKAMSVEEFESALQSGATLIDTRHPNNFQEGFIPSSINIGLNGQYAIWAATLFDLDRKIILVTDPGKEQESIVRLTRVGFMQIAGFLDGGFAAWQNAGKPTDLVVSITPEEFALDLKFGNDRILDVRKPGEFESGHLVNAELFSLDSLQQNLNRISASEDLCVHCAGGYRSMIACSILKANGIQRVKNVMGGYAKIKEAGADIVIPQAQNAQA